MKHAWGIGRVVGLGIGAALVAVPWVASADTFDPNDFAISVDGTPLFQVGAASATSGAGDFAIADGAGSSATATGGIFDFASADGADSNATATAGNFDLGIADGINSSVGAGSSAVAGGGTGSNDIAIDIGNNNGTLLGAQAGAGNNDTAIDIGNNTGNLDGALAISGNNDTAIDVGNNNGYGSGAGAFFGNSNTGITLGDNSGDLAGAEAGYGNFDTATDVGNNIGDSTVLGHGFGPTAGDTGNFDIATPAKALFDALYLSTRRGRLLRHFPELSWPANFSRRELREWIAKIDDSKLRVAVTERWDVLRQKSQP